MADSYSYTRHHDEADRDEWVGEQFRKAFPEAGQYRYAMFDRDSIFNPDVMTFLRSTGIRLLRTSVHAPWQNGGAERWVGGCRGELLDHVNALHEARLRRLIGEYVAYFHQYRPHDRLDPGDNEMADTRTKDSAADRIAARRLVKTVVLAQGNIFIRELLRDKKLPIGVNKEEFEANLLRAIDTGELTLAELASWLEKVEGWGDQHVYVYHLHEVPVADPAWSVENVKRRLPKNYLKLWNASSLVFPDDWELTGISYDGVSLCYIWHKRLTTLLRKPKQDRREQVDGDWYQFRAHLERPDRAVMRFVLRRDRGIAAVFMQIPAEGNAHEQALARVRGATTPLVDWSTLTEFSASDAIKNLDQAALNNEPGAKVKQKKTRLTDAGDYVEFATDSEMGGFGQAVRSVRRAVTPSDFTGNVGVFLYIATARAPSDPPVRIEISGPERRIRLWAQLKADEVWQILDLLEKFERRGTTAQTATP